jgi:hypothetical protein
MTLNNHWSGYAPLSILRLSNSSITFHSTHLQQGESQASIKIDQKSDKCLVLWYEHPEPIPTNTTRKPINQNLGVDEIVCQSILRVSAYKAIITYSFVIRIFKKSFDLL